MALKRAGFNLKIGVPVAKEASYNVTSDAYQTETMKVMQDGIRFQHNNSDNPKAVSEMLARVSKQLAADDGDRDHDDGGQDNSVQNDVFHKNRVDIRHLTCLRDLGHGASGSVQLFQRKPGTEPAEGERPDGLFAVKKIPINEKQFRRQLQSELVALTDSGNCSRLVQYYGCAFDADQACVSVILEYMDVGNLRTVLRLSGGVPETVLSYWTKCMLEGLVYLHGKHQLHRDFKPDNVVVDSRGSCKLVDFGISRDIHVEDAGTETKKSDNQIGVALKGSSYAATFVGTTAYMSPERVLGGSYTYAADLWALGVTVVECFTGKHPFGSPNMFVDFMKAVVGAKLPALESRAAPFSAAAVPPRMPKSKTRKGRKTITISRKSGSKSGRSTRKSQPEENSEGVARAVQQPERKQSSNGLYPASPELHHFVELCTARQPHHRPSLEALLKHPFVLGVPFTSEMREKYAEFQKQLLTAQKTSEKPKDINKEMTGRVKQLKKAWWSCDTPSPLSDRERRIVCARWIRTWIDKRDKRESYDVCVPTQLQDQHTMMRTVTQDGNGRGGGADVQKTQVGGGVAPLVMTEVPVTVVQGGRPRISSIPALQQEQEGN